MKVPIKFNYLLSCKIFLVCIIFISCKHEESTTPKNSYLLEIDKLPELPLDSISGGRGLVFDLTEPTLTIPIEPIEKDKPIINRPHECGKESYSKREYLTQVTYPKVICYPNNAPTNQVVKGILQERTGNDIGDNPHSKGEEVGIEYFKLSILKKEKLQNPLLCSVHYGPWAAKVIESGRCCDEDDILWELSVPSIPEIYLAWTNRFDDIPLVSFPNLGVFPNDLFLLNEGFECCPGYTPTIEGCVKLIPGDGPDGI